MKSGNAADLKQVLGDILSARLQIGDVWRLLEDFGHVEQVELDARFVGDGRQVQRSVGGAAGCGDDRCGVLQRPSRVTISRGRMLRAIRHSMTCSAGSHAELVAQSRMARVRRQNMAEQGQWLQTRLPWCWR